MGDRPDLPSLRIYRPRGPHVDAPDPGPAIEVRESAPPVAYWADPPPPPPPEPVPIWFWVQGWLVGLGAVCSLAAAGMLLYLILRL